jgi:hypothetical protein
LLFAKESLKNNTEDFKKQQERLNKEFYGIKNVNK